MVHTLNLSVRNFCKNYRGKPSHCSSTVFTRILNLGVQSENPKKKIRKSPDVRPDFPFLGKIVPPNLRDNPAPKKKGGGTKVGTWYNFPHFHSLSMSLSLRVLCLDETNHILKTFGSKTAYPQTCAAVPKLREQSS